jgi:ABC-type nitrate/sulfonate/bicarbonate transport system permease component
MKLLTPFADVGSSLKYIAVTEAVILIALWFLAPDSLIPSPLEIATTWNTLATQQGLLVELFNSGVTIAKALVLSSIVSFGIAFLSTAALLRPISRWLTALRFLGFAGITFMFTMWTSNGAELKALMLTFGMTVFLMTNAMAMVESITQAQVDYARTLKLNAWQTLWEVGMRGKLDETLDLMRQNVAIGWVMLSMVEGLVRSEGGIGAMLLNQSQHLHLSAIFAIQLTILGYGILQDMALRYLREVACPYIPKVR